MQNPNITLKGFQVDFLPCKFKQSIIIKYCKILGVLTDKLTDGFIYSSKLNISSSLSSFLQVSESRVVECPSIQITTISPEDDPAQPISSYWDMGGGGGWDRERLYLPLLDPFTYRERCPGSLSPSPSPGSSPSSRGWLSPASSCDSLLVEEEELNEAAVSFGLSPSSRPTSPGGKKRRNSPLASPCTSRRGSYSEELQGCNLEGRDPSAPQPQAPPGGCELSIPQKTRKTSLEQVRVLAWFFFLSVKAVSVSTRH